MPKKKRADLVQALKDFYPILEKIENIVGWESLSPRELLVDFDYGEEGEICLEIDCNQAEVTDGIIKKIKTLLPESKEISFQANPCDNEEDEPTTVEMVLRIRLC